MIVRFWLAFNAVAVKLCVYTQLGSTQANASSCAVKLIASKRGWINALFAVLSGVCA